MDLICKTLSLLHPKMFWAKLKLAQWFWRRRFKKFRQCIFPISLLPPHWKGMTLHLNKLKSPSPNDVRCQVWLKLALLFWRTRWKKDKFWSETLTWAFSSGEQIIILQLYVKVQRCLMHGELTLTIFHILSSLYNFKHFGWIII